MVDDARLVVLREQLMDRVQDVVRQAVSYQAGFESYSYLWIDDRQECMSQFLTYGQVLTAEDLDLLAAGPVIPVISPDGEEQITTGLVPKAPTLEQFKQQIDHYEKIYEEVSGCSRPKKRN